MRPASTPAGGPSAVHRAVDTELERVARRWQQLPLGRAVTAYPQVYAVVQALADAVADATAQSREVVPDLGPGVVVDQLRVMVYDWRQAAAGVSHEGAMGEGVSGEGAMGEGVSGEGAMGKGLDEQDLADRLTALRRALP